MTPPANSERYKHHRFPGEIISHGVWLYYKTLYMLQINSASSDTPPRARVASPHGSWYYQ